MWVAIAMIFGLDTLVSQAYGAGNYKLIGIILQNAVFIGTLACIPVALLWFFTESKVIWLDLFSTLCRYYDSVGTRRSVVSQSWSNVKILFARVTSIYLLYGTIFTCLY
jgi:hypothetical protein